jgi:hypothetical protein
MMFAQDFRKFIEQNGVMLLIMNTIRVDITYKNLNLLNRFCFLDKQKSDQNCLPQKINSYFIIKGN